MSFSLPLFLTFTEKEEKEKMTISKNVLKNNNYWKTLRAVRIFFLTLLVLLMVMLVVMLVVKLVANKLLSILSKQLTNYSIV